MVTAKDLMKTDYIKLNVDDHISKFMGVILHQNETYALLFSGNTYKGYADKKFFVRTKMDPGQMKVSHILNHVPTLSPNTDLAEIARLFLASDTRVLPVIEHGKVLGIVKESDLIPFIKSDFKGLKVSDLLTNKRLVKFFDKDPVGLVIHRMKDEHVDRAPVTTLRGELVGIVTYVDLYAKFHVWQSANLSKMRGGNYSNQSGGSKEKTADGQVPVENFMTKLCISCTAKDSLLEAANKICTECVTSLVVLENNTPVGIITITDLLKRYLS